MRKILITAVLLGAPRAALACPVCFGQNDSPLAVAMNQGILMMLGVVVLMLGAFASFFVVLIRRANRAAEQMNQADAAQPADASRYAMGEGTAQC
jgi:Na+-transporting NADH:ubiquinone oxidoreductase subunit NqrD